MLNQRQILVSGILRQYNHFSSFFSRITVESYLKVKDGVWWGGGKELKTLFDFSF